jgi:2-oxo-3-hexenedioate decarboxylase
VGWKAGLTSKAKMIQMGVNVPSIGFLTDRMARPENSAISTADLVHPRVECEVAFVTKKALPAPDVHPRRTCWTATDLRAAGGRDHRFALLRLQVRPAQRGGRQRLVGALCGRWPGALRAKTGSTWTPWAW